MMPIRSLVVAPLPGGWEQSPVPGCVSRDRKFSGSVTAVGLSRKPGRGRAPQPAKLAPLQRAPSARVTQHGGPGGGEGRQAGEAAPGSSHGQNNASESWPRPSCRPCGPGSGQELHWKPSTGTEVLLDTCRQNQGEGSITSVASCRHSWVSGSQQGLESWARLTVGHPEPQGHQRAARWRLPGAPPLEPHLSEPHLPGPRPPGGPHLTTPNTSSRLLPRLTFQLQGRSISCPRFRGQEQGGSEGHLSQRVRAQLDLAQVF